MDNSGNRKKWENKRKRKRQKSESERKISREYRPQKKPPPSIGSGGFQYDKLFQANGIIDGPSIGSRLKRRIPIRDGGLKADAVPIMR